MRKRRPVVRRPHGPINKAYGLMWFDFKMGKVKFEPRPATQPATAPGRMPDKIIKETAA